jgi:hypothetical protein
MCKSVATLPSISFAQAGRRRGALVVYPGTRAESTGNRSPTEAFSEMDSQQRVAVMQTTREFSDRSHIAMDAEAGDVAHPSVDEARQGVTGHNVRYVLAISLGAALVALAVAWFLIT